MQKIAYKNSKYGAKGRSLLKSEKILGIVLIYIIVPALAIILLSTLTINPSVQDEKILDFSDGWEYYNPVTRESGVVDLPAIIEGVPKNVPVQLTNRIPASGISNPTLFFITQQQKVSIFLDDKLIYNFGSSPKQFGRSPGNSIHFVSLQGSHENSKITIQMSSSHSFFSGIISGFVIGNRGILLLDLIKKDIFPLIVSLLMLFLGIILLFLFSVMSLSRINDSSTFYLALFSIFGGFWLTSERMLLLIFFNDPVFTQNLAYMSLYLLPIPFLLYIKSVYRLKRDYIPVFLSWAFLVFTTLTTILQVLGIIDFITVLPVFHVLTFASSLYVCIISLKKTKEERKSLTFFIFSCLALAFFYLLDLLLFYVSYIHKINHLSYFQIGMLLFIVINIGSLSENLFHIRDMNIKNRLLLSLAYIDTLTHLKNRTSFDEMMHALNSSLKNGLSLNLIILDINNLKTINDTYGHIQGDNLLVESAKILKVTIGQLGEVYRIGGDEFACIIINSDEYVINDYISDLFEQIDRYNEIDKNLKMSIAYGMASYQAELDNDIHSLFVRADKAMYNNKETQRIIKVIG